MTTNLHEMEEIEYRFGPRLWDAGEGVCCAAFQLGACSHTEDFDPDEAFAGSDPSWDEFEAESLAAMAAAGYAGANIRKTADGEIEVFTDDEPF